MKSTQRPTNVHDLHLRAETADDAAQVRAIAQPAAKTLDQWRDDGVYWLKVWTEDRDLPRKVRPYASLERREW